MTTRSLPRGYVRCDECRGTGRETVTDEVLDDDGEFVAEISRDYGRCEICGGRGYLAEETPEQKAARAAQDRNAAIMRHLETATVHGYHHCGWGCPIADDLRREHVASGDHDRLCVDGCVGY